MPVLVPTVEPSSATALIETHFSKLRDPRAIHNIDHLLIDIIVITLCATICGANDWEAVAEYGRIKYEWLKKFLPLPNGIPSHDTFSRLFARLNPEELQSCFRQWMQAVHQVTKGELLDEKSNEITAIPELLKLLEIQGCLVSIDAMGCQTEIAKTIIEQGADYVLALKANQGNLYEDVSQLFDLARQQDLNDLGDQFHKGDGKGTWGH